MMDYETTIEDLKKQVTTYRKEYELDKTDTMFELIKAVNVEAGELLECITFDRGTKQDVTHELADVFIYCLALADLLCLDVEEIIMKKIRYNKERGRKYEKI